MSRARWLQSFHRHRREHPLVRRTRRRLARAGVDVGPVSVWWVPRWLWREVLREVGFPADQLGQVKAFTLDGDVYVPEGRARYSMVHEVLHAAGLDEDVGGPWVVEGLTEEVEHELGVPLIETMPTRGPYRARRRWVSQTLLPATGFDSATELVVELLEAPNPRARLAELSGISEQAIASAADRPPTPGPRPPDVQRAHAKLDIVGSILSTIALNATLAVGRGLRRRRIDRLPERIAARLEEVHRLHEAGRVDAARREARSAARLMKRLGRAEPDHPVLRDAVAVADYAAGRDEQLAA